MKFVLVIFATTALFAAAEQPPKKSSSSAPAAPAPAPKRLTIPEGAVQKPDGRFSFTDAEGRNWIYVRTPFGVTRFEDKPGAPGATVAATDAAGGAAAAAKSQDPFSNVKITEAGDVVTFERPSPFGVSKWQKKKSELTEQENAAMLRAREKGKSSDSAKQD